MKKILTLSPCNLCPRMCGADRTKETGFCGGGENIKIARAALHHWEEPCISGTRGSGTVFFSGCPLKCRYCQNADISLGGFGKEVSPERLAEIFLELEARGAHNINLVTASHYLLPVIKALDIVKPALGIPVVWNTGGYERAEAINALIGYVDIYLPDIKYCDSALSRKYSNAPDYFDIALKAVVQMIEQTGEPRFGEDGMMQSGVIVRHMVLPGARKDSIEVLRRMSEALPRGKYLLSLMSQYTPPAEPMPYAELNRRVTAFEYQSVVDEAVKLGMTNGFMQEKGSAKKEYTPPFDLEGV